MNRLERSKLGSLEKLGIALSEMKAKIEGVTYDGHLISFTSRPTSSKVQIGSSDMILLSRGNPLGPATWRGVVSDMSSHTSSGQYEILLFFFVHDPFFPTRRVVTLRVVFPTLPTNLLQGTWRIDKCENRITHDRMVTALKVGFSLHLSHKITFPFILFRVKNFSQPFPLEEFCGL